MQIKISLRTTAETRNRNKCEFRMTGRQQPLASERGEEPKMEKRHQIALKSSKVGLLKVICYITLQFSMLIAHALPTERQKAYAFS